MAAPEGLVTTTNNRQAPVIDPDVAARARAQLDARTAQEEEALRAEQAKQNFNPDEPTSLQKGNADQARSRDMMARAARQRAMAGQAEEPLVPVRVTKLGSGKVSMGIHVDGIGEAYYEHKETFSVQASVAKRLEDRGFVEIED